jgi:hypothetical protein
MEFLLSSLNSSHKIEIPLNELGPVRKEWLAALIILGSVSDKNPQGWETLIDWTEGFLQRLKTLKPKHTDLGYVSQPI